MMEVWECGSKAAHSPHQHWRNGALLGCPGIAPIWPCGKPAPHHNHWVEGAGFNFDCPGTALPPTDMIGPWYPSSMIPGYDGS